MTAITAAWHWLKAHYGTILVVLGVMSAIATFINMRLPKDADGYVMKPPSGWGPWVWRLIVDVLSWAPQPGRSGPFGLPVTAPGLPSFGKNTEPSAPRGVDPPPPIRPGGDS